MSIVTILSVVFLVGLTMHNSEALKRDPPEVLTNIIYYIESGVIPPQLQLMIPTDYEKREDYSMSAELDRILLERNNRPMWTITLTLDDGVSQSQQTLLYDNNGDLYQ